MIPRDISAPWIPSHAVQTEGNGSAVEDGERPRIAERSHCGDRRYVSDAGHSRRRTREYLAWHPRGTGRWKLEASRGGRGRVTRRRDVDRWLLTERCVSVEAGQVAGQQLHLPAPAEHVMVITALALPAPRHGEAVAARERKHSFVRFTCRRIRYEHSICRACTTEALRNHHKQLLHHPHITQTLDQKKLLHHTSHHHWHTHPCSYRCHDIEQQVTMLAPVL